MAGFSLAQTFILTFLQLQALRDQPSSLIKVPVKYKLHNYLGLLKLNRCPLNFPQTLLIISIRPKTIFNNFYTAAMSNNLIQGASLQREPMASAVPSLTSKAMYFSYCSLESQVSVSTQLLSSFML